LTTTDGHAEFDLIVEQGKVREFAAATHSQLAAYNGADATVPPTFLTSRSFWAASDTGRPDVGFDRKRMLHAEQEYVFHGPPPRVGDQLRVASHIAETYEKTGKRGGKMRFAVIRTEFCDQDGRLVAEEFSTVLETARVPE
jgi:hypothetical protein